MSISMGRSQLFWTVKRTLCCIILTSNCYVQCFCRLCDRFLTRQKAIRGVGAEAEMVQAIGCAPTVRRTNATMAPGGRSETSHQSIHGASWIKISRINIEVSYEIQQHFRSRKYNLTHLSCLFIVWIILQRVFPQSFGLSAHLGRRTRFTSTSTQADNSKPSGLELPTFYIRV
jgi:hypothetical protein